MFFFTNLFIAWVAKWKVNIINGKKFQDIKLGLLGSLVEGALVPYYHVWMNFSSHATLLVQAHIYNILWFYQGILSVALSESGCSQEVHPIWSKHCASFWVWNIKPYNFILNNFSFIKRTWMSFKIYRYTLGGLYLAQYDTSPADVFDEVHLVFNYYWMQFCTWCWYIIVPSWGWYWKC